jgi:hypothetical protein
MAHSAWLTDGDTTVQLASTNAMLVNYTPRSGEPTAPGRASDGEWIGTAWYPFVTETLELYLYAASKSALQDVQRSIERLLHRARERQAHHAGARVYLHLKVDAETNDWRSEVIGGNLELDESALAVFANVGYEARLHITRRTWWEEDASSATALSVSSAATTSATTSGASITNTYDSNWVQIAAAQINGSLPTPVKLSIKNTVAGSEFYSTVWVQNNVYWSPATADVWMTGAESRAATGSLSLTNPTGLTADIDWNIATARLDAFLGAYCRVLMVIDIPGSGAQAVPYVQWGGSSASTALHIWEGAWVDVAAEVVDLGLVPLPPGGYTTGYDDLYLGVGFRYTGSWSATVQYIQFVPVNSERRVKQILFTENSLAQNEYVVIDDMEGEVYHLETSSDKLPTYSARGGPLWLYPGMINRLYITSMGENGAFDLTRTALVTADYKPRRLTI